MLHLKLAMRLFFRKTSPIGSINDRIFPLTNWHVVLMGYTPFPMICRTPSDASIAAVSEYHHAWFLLMAATVKQKHQLLNNKKNHT